MKPDIDKFRSSTAMPVQSVVLAHRNPDGDALGSSLAWAQYLRSRGQSVTVILPSEFPKHMSWMPGAKDILIFDNFPDEGREAISLAQQIYALDFNSWERVDPLQHQLLESTATKFLVDHHLDPEPYFDAYYSDPTACSTAELIYRLIEDMNQLDKMDHIMAENLYVGMLTDTGSFRYTISAEVFRVASGLLAKGVDPSYIQNKVFNTQSRKHLELLGHCLANRMRIFPDLGTGVIYLNLDDHRKFKIQRGDTEGIVNYILSLNKINLAALITQQNKQYIKLSLRSKGDFSVQKLASQHFNGGGHKNASGGRSDLSLEDTMKKIVDLANTHKSEIINSF